MCKIIVSKGLWFFFDTKERLSVKVSREAEVLVLPLANYVLLPVVKPGSILRLVVRMALVASPKIVHTLRTEIVVVMLH